MRGPPEGRGARAAGRCPPLRDRRAGRRGGMSRRYPLTHLSPGQPYLLSVPPCGLLWRKAMARGALGLGGGGAAERAGAAQGPERTARESRLPSRSAPSHLPPALTDTDTAPRLPAGRLRRPLHGDRYAGGEREERKKGESAAANPCPLPARTAEPSPLAAAKQTRSRPHRPRPPGYFLTPSHTHPPLRCNGLSRSRRPLPTPPRGVLAGESSAAARGFGARWLRGGAGARARARNAAETCGPR